MCVPPSGARQRHAVISSPRSSAVSMCGVSPGRRWKSAIGMRARAAVGPHRLDRRVEHAHAPPPCRSGWVAMQASLAPITASWRLNAADGAAAAARLALVAGLVGVVEVGAARALQQVAGGGGLVAQLARGAGQQRARQHAVVAPHALVGGQVGVAHQRADAQAALRRRLDLVERQAVDVDQVRGRLDLQLHQVEQVGAAGDELARRACAATAAAASAGRCGALVGEGLHARTPATSVIASTMLE